MTLDDNAYADRYAFRPRAWNEGTGTYRAALIEHVRARDFAASFELRLDKRQADWSRDDVQAFHDFLQQERPPRAQARREFSLLVHQTGPWPVTLESLNDLADEALALYTETRQQNATVELAIVVNVLLTDGRLLSAEVSRGNRVAALTSLAQNLPVFGYFILFDAFMHVINAEKGTATKQDSLLVHLGTREARVMKRRPYVITGSRARFITADESIMPLDLDMRGDPALKCDDPYAAVFVSVPAPTGQPS